MKIQNLANISYLFKTNRNNKQQTSPTIQLRNQLSSDVINFSGKNYSANSVKNQTNHCAYCGCKVYNEIQIDSLAKEMLKDSSHRLQGVIKSVLEKLEAAVRSEELTVAKQLANRKEIEFYKKFLEQAIDKSWLKGEAIFEQVYNMKQEEALAELKRNMRPLTKTIDHVSPQKLGEDNKDEDINLVEACYCCNHDLKEGTSFAEFYRMYPSIKENMPADKFKYAHTRLLASSSGSVLLGITGLKLSKYKSELIALRNKAIGQLHNVNFRILELLPSINHDIEARQEEICRNEERIISLQSKLDAISDDAEYKAMVKRERFLQQESQLETELSNLRELRKNVNNSKNELEKPSKKGRKNKEKLSDEIKSQKLASYRQQIIDLNQQIKEKELQLEQLLEELKNLDRNFPTLEMLQAKKNSYDSIINTFAQLNEEESRLLVLNQIASKLDFDIAQLEAEIKKYPNETFDTSQYSPEEQQIYSHYIMLTNALKYTDQHITGDSIRATVNRSARKELEREMQSLSEVPIVADSINHVKRKDLVAQKDKKIKEKEENKKSITISQHKIIQFKRVVSVCSLEEAEIQSAEISKWMRRLNDKQNYMQLPRTIEKLEAENVLLNQSIKELENDRAHINSLNLDKG